MVKSSKTAEEAHGNGDGSTNRGALSTIKHDYILAFACGEQRSPNLFNGHSSMESGASSW